MKKVLIAGLFVVASATSFAVTKDQAEANPSDGELNRTYAIEMLAEGNLTEALAGIEREDKPELLRLVGVKPRDSGPNEIGDECPFPRKGKVLPDIFYSKNNKSSK